MDKDCASKLACIIQNGRGECLNPCTTFRPCVEHAECKVYDSLPLRTMTCTCVDGFTGKGDQLCERIGMCHRYTKELNEAQISCCKTSFNHLQLNLWLLVALQMTSVQASNLVSQETVSILVLQIIHAVPVQNAQSQIIVQLACVHLAQRVIHFQTVHPVSVMK